MNIRMFIVSVIKCMLTYTYVLSAERAGDSCHCRRCQASACHPSHWKMMSALPDEKQMWSYQLISDDPFLHRFANTWHADNDMISHIFQVHVLHWLVDQLQDRSRWPGWGQSYSGPGVQEDCPSPWHHPGLHQTASLLGWLFPGLYWTHWLQWQWTCHHRVWIECE